MANFFWSILGNIDSENRAFRNFGALPLRMIFAFPKVRSLSPCILQLANKCASLQFVLNRKTSYIRAQRSLSANMAPSQPAVLAMLSPVCSEPLLSKLCRHYPLERKRDSSNGLREEAYYWERQQGMLTRRAT